MKGSNPHFTFIAQLLQDARGCKNRFDFDNLVNFTAKQLKDANPNFDYARFIKAAGIPRA